MSSKHARSACMRWPTPAEIQAAFDATVVALGGAPQCAVGAPRFLRAVLPCDAAVHRNDVVRAGVALRVAHDAIHVHPYVLRLVCTNGAIRAHALESRRIARVAAPAWRVPHEDASRVLAAVRDAVCACADAAALARAVAEAQHARQFDGAVAIRRLHELLRRARLADARTTGGVRERWAAEDDRSAYGVFNAVTALARDTAHPGRRWQLEVVGAALPACLVADEQRAGGRQSVAATRTAAGRGTTLAMR